jgi:hypothetical protein
MSLGNWYQAEGNPLRFDSKMEGTAGGGLYRADVLVPYPAEDFGWNPTTSPFPVALVAPAGTFDNKFLLLVDQLTYKNGIWKFPANAAAGPPEFVIDMTDSAIHGNDFLGQRISINSVAQSIFGEVAVGANFSTGALGYTSINGSAPAIFTAYTTNINVANPPLQSDGVTPLTDLTGGTPVPILLTAQTNSAENGFWFATASRATRTTLRDRPSGIPDPVVTLFGDDGDVAATGSWWVSDLAGSFNSI